MVCPMFLIMNANKTKAVIWATLQRSSQRCFSTYLILLTIRGRDGSARESCKARACSVRPAYMITPSHMMSARNQTSAQWQMHTVRTVSITNTIWQICPLSWLEDGLELFLFIYFYFISSGLRNDSSCFSDLETEWIPVAERKCEQHLLK